MQGREGIQAWVFAMRQYALRCPNGGVEGDGLDDRFGLSEAVAEVSFHFGTLLVGLQDVSSQAFADAPPGRALIEVPRIVPYVERQPFAHTQGA